MSTKALESLARSSACGKGVGNENCTHCEVLAELENLRKAARGFVSHEWQPNSREYREAKWIFESIAKEAP